MNWLVLHGSNLLSVCSSFLGVGPSTRDNGLGKAFKVQAIRIGPMHAHSGCGGLPSCAMARRVRSTKYDTTVYNTKTYLDAHESFANPIVSAELSFAD